MMKSAKGELQLMKFKTAMVFLLGAKLVLPAVAEDEPQMHDAATHDQLAAAYRQAQQDDPMRKLPKSPGKDASLINPPKDLLSESDLLCYGGIATLLPKRAVLHLPKEFEERMKIVPGARIVGWPEFYAQNRGWITSVEVSRVQAEGNEALAAETSKRIGKSANLIVATYKNGPISVLPLKAKPAPKPAAQAVANPDATSAEPVTEPDKPAAEAVPAASAAKPPSSQRP